MAAVGEDRYAEGSADVGEVAKAGFQARAVELQSTSSGGLVAVGQGLIVDGCKLRVICSTLA